MEASGITQEELLRSASGFAPDAPAALTAAEMIRPKVFEHQFKSPWPEYEGQVVMHYPTLGEMLRIERMAMGGETYAELAATLAVCIDKAPAAWYRLPEGQTKPVLNLDAFQDSEGLLVLWRAYLDWRRLFRS